MTASLFKMLISEPSKPSGGSAAPSVVEEAKYYVLDPKSGQALEVFFKASKICPETIIKALWKCDVTVMSESFINTLSSILVQVNEAEGAREVVNLCPQILVWNSLGAFLAIYQILIT